MLVPAGWTELDHARGEQGTRSRGRTFPHPGFCCRRLGGTGTAFNRVASCEKFSSENSALGSRYHLPCVLDPISRLLFPLGLGCPAVKGPRSSCGSLFGIESFARARAQALRTGRQLDQIHPERNRLRIKVSMPLFICQFCYYVATQSSL
jgi:hypothetical protein